MLYDSQITKEFCSKKLVKIFDYVFSEDYATRLVGGGEEPVYIPGVAGEQSRIIFRHDYFASALHEVAHWCVAGDKRRRLEDYGYWYAPDGRTQEQQALFEQVEIKPQALEWIFSMACGYKFRVSADNLLLDAGPSMNFKRNIFRQVKMYCTSLPQRPMDFVLEIRIN